MSLNEMLPHDFNLFINITLSFIWSLYLWQIIHIYITLIVLYDIYIYIFIYFLYDTPETLVKELDLLPILESIN